MKSGIHAFEESASQGRRWLREISEGLGGSTDDEEALQALRGALHALRDQLTVEQSAHLSSQLPVIIRGVYYEEWLPATVPARDRNRDRFLERVLRYFPDKDRTLDPGDVATAVFAVLQRHISAGESEKIYHVLASDIKRLWTALGSTASPISTQRPIIP